MVKQWRNLVKIERFGSNCDTSAIGPVEDDEEGGTGSGRSRGEVMEDWK